jgi:hypothetical protein
MSLKIETFQNASWRPGNNFGGSSLFKALGHPITARLGVELMRRIRQAGPVAVYDPLGEAADFDVFYGLSACDIAGVYVQQISEIGADILGHEAKPVTDLPASNAATVLVCAFDAERFIDHIRALAPPDAVLVSFDDMRLPAAWLSNPRRYLDPINFTTNFGFLRDSGDLHTIVSSVNYWSGYGAENPALWLCLFAEDGRVLAEWEEPLGGVNETYIIDSRQVRKRFGLDDFAGSLFIHAIRVRGHDVVKYAIDTFSDDGRQLSATHDANAWPADLYAGMPAPGAGERLTLWIQNSHPISIPAGAIGFNAMGSQDITWLEAEIPPFGTYPVDVGALLPDLAWPSQIEIQAGRYFVRPRYEVENAQGRRRIAHANVERTDLKTDPTIPKLGALMGKGYIMPLPVLPTDRFQTSVLPTPMATCQQELPVAAVLYDASGDEIARKFMGRIKRRDSVPLDIDDWLAESGKSLPAGYGHVELAYDFSDGGDADGWLHALALFQHRESGHQAETIFGAHIYNTPIVYKDEPQSYIARPPGLSTRIFLRLGNAPYDTQCHLIYPASLPWRDHSETNLILHSGKGAAIETKTVRIPCGGSLNWRYSTMFDAATRAAAGDGAYVQVRDATVRLFGFHGLINGETSCSLDHMFGF